MKTLYFFTISMLVIIAIGMSVKLPLASSDSGSLTELYTPSPDLANMSPSLSDTFTQASPNSTKDLHLEFFDAKNNTAIKNVSFFINATKDGKVLMNDLFYTKTGSMTIKFSPGNDTKKWTVTGSRDPILGGWMSENNTLPITTSAFAGEGTYHIHFAVLALVYVNGMVDPSNPPTFDSWWSVDEKGNISNYNSTISFGSATPSFKIKDESPLKQFKSGIAAKDVKCNNGFLILKAEGGSPACVTIETGKKLAMRGWATTFRIGTDYWTSCNTTYPQSDSGIPVLYMPTNSLGKICVKYYSMNNPSTNVGINIFEANNMSQSATEITHWTYNSTRLQGNENTTISYFIKTGNNTGFYGLSISGCGGIPFAVGYDSNSTITASDFPWAGHVIECGVIAYDSQIDSTEGIGVRYIPYSGMP